jgi:hypothetical protein
MSKLTMLHTGAIRQVGERQDAQEQSIQNLIAENATLKSTLARLEHRNA